MEIAARLALIGVALFAAPAAVADDTLFAGFARTLVDWKTEFTGANLVVQQVYSSESVAEVTTPGRPTAERRVLWRLIAVWHVPDPKRVPLVAESPDQVRAVVIDFPGADAATRMVVIGRLKGDDTRARLSDAETVARRAETAVAQQMLAFFWQPKYTYSTGSQKPRETPQGPRLELIPEPRSGGDGGKGEPPHSTSPYTIRDRKSLVPWEFNASGSKEAKQVWAFLDLLNRVGREGGRLRWLVEPGRSPHELIAAWQPTGRPWERPVLASPAWEVTAEPEVVDFPQLLAGHTNVCRLAAGTCERIAGQLNAGGRLIALGPDGLAFQQRGHETPTYDVHLVRGKGPDAKYAAKPTTTRGLASDPPPKWPAVVGFPRELLTVRLSADEGRHLVALAVCSPEVWGKSRGGPTPTPAFAPLGADPELWALPTLR